MKKRAILLPLLIGVVLMEGCWGPTTVPLKDALRAVEDDLLQAKVVNMTDVLGEDSNAVTQMEEQIMNFQCFYGKANPLIPVFAKDFTLTLQGTFTVGGAVSVSPGPAGPTGGVGFSVSDAKTQGLTVPITFTPLDSLPDMYLQQRISYVSSLAPTERMEYFNSIKQPYSDLTKKIKSLMNKWPETQKSDDCKKKLNKKLQGGGIHTYTVQ